MAEAAQHIHCVSFCLPLLLQVSGREVFEFRPELVDDDDDEADDTRYAKGDEEDEEDDVVEVRLLR